MLRIKSFIYRFSNIFGMHIYLAQKEEREFIKSQEVDSELSEEYLISMWQAKNGFTSVWTDKMSFHRAILTKVKHAFNFKGFRHG